jgi:hypothetical protein
MRHFAEFIVFNGFNPISFGAAAKAAVARADEKPRAEAADFLKNNTAPAALARNCRLFVARPCPAVEPLRVNSGLGKGVRPNVRKA